MRGAAGRMNVKTTERFVEVTLLLSRLRALPDVFADRARHAAKGSVAI
jgi:hypothetical protein